MSRIAHTYSIVAAVGPLPSGAASETKAADEILVNRWLADDLSIEPGDRVQMTYFVPGRKRSFEERAETFRVRAVLPMDTPVADRDMMPKFPGLAEMANCREWEPGLPVDLSPASRVDHERE